jgi:hypothetical protein
VRGPPADLDVYSVQGSALTLERGSFVRIWRPRPSVRSTNRLPERPAWKVFVSSQEKGSFLWAHHLPFLTSPAPDDFIHVQVR